MAHGVGHIATEEEYFHQLDAELIEDMHRRAVSEERHLRMAEASGINDPKILDTLQNLGYSDTTVTLLEVVPLLQVAWIGNSISQRERDRIVAIAARHGVRPNTPAHQQLTAWMDRPPREEFFQGTLRAIQAVYNSLPVDQRRDRSDALIHECAAMASASCQLFGWTSRACAAKQKLLGEIEKHFPAERRRSTGSAHAI